MSDIAQAFADGIQSGRDGLIARISHLEEQLAAMTTRAEAAEAKLAAVPWLAIHRVHMAAQGMDLDDWITVADWTHNNMPQQEAQP
jgi:hypothetical protein